MTCEVLPFPLYDSYYNNQDTHIDVGAIIRRISALRNKDPKTAYKVFRVIYAFCVHHHIKEFRTIPTTNPYNIVTCDGGKGIILPLTSCMPPDLLCTIDRYLCNMVTLNT
jgi:hypothetical protein